MAERTVIELLMADFLHCLEVTLPNLPMKAWMTYAGIQTIEELGRITMALEFEGNLSNQQFKFFHGIGHVYKNKW